MTLRETPLVKINAEFLKVVEDIKPNIVFIPHKGDMHMDHTVVSHSAMVALRPLMGLMWRIFMHMKQPFQKQDGCSQ